jgi:hypothetical protein
MVDITATADKTYHPSLFDVHEFLDINIVGEFDTRMATFTNWVLAHQNVNLAGQRASGKTWVVDHVSKFLPDKNGLYDLSAGSEKNLWYQAEAMREHSHIKIPELNKVPKAAIEVLKDWGEGRMSEYRVTIFEAGIRRVHPYKLKPKPFIFCVADEEELKIDDQLRSRLTVIRSDITESQNQAVNIQQAELAMIGNPKKFDEVKFKKLKHHIQTLPPWDELSYRHPAASLFVGCIPTVFTDCRRDFPKYLKNTYGITRFYWKNRMSTDISMLDDNNKVVKKKVWFVTPEDMYYNHIIYGSILIESSLRCSNMERQLIRIVEKASEPLSRDAIQARVRKIGMNISAQMITRHMNALTNLGYCECIKVGASRATYTLGKLFKDFNFDINWSDVIAECIKTMKEYYKDYADEYIKKYCVDTVVKHPYTGIDIKLSEVEERIVNDTDTSVIGSDPAPIEDEIENLVTESEAIDDNVEVEEIV